MNRDDASKFQVGDRVYAPFHGYGTVIKVHEHPSVYPIVVKKRKKIKERANPSSKHIVNTDMHCWTKNHLE